MVSGIYVDALAKIGKTIKLKGVLSAHQSTADAFVKNYFSNASEPPIVYSNVASIAADPTIDFVIVTTPPNARKALIQELTAAGKPILMEKPIERDLEAATELCTLCESSGVPLGIVLQHRARPSVKALNELIESGETGPLQSAEIIVPWWREQSYYDEPGRGTFERDGGGVMINQAIHTLDLALQFTGPVNDVIALTTTTQSHTMETEDFVCAGLQFTNGAAGSFFCSTASYPGRAENIILHYENVSATLESSLLILNWRDGRSTTLGEAVASGAGANPMAFTSDWHRFMIENFMSALAGKEKILATARSALSVHALIKALEKSGRSGQREAVDTIGASL